MHDALASPLVIRAVVGVAGGVLVVAGARVYKAALFLATFAVGAAGAAAGLHALSPHVDVAPSAVPVAAVVAGAALAGVAAFVHRVALAGVGAFVGAVTAGAVAAWLAPGSPWWVPAIGGLVGTIAM